MGFFSELKSDLSQAVNTLMPEDKLAEADNLDKENQKEDSTNGSFEITLSLQEERQ